MPKAVLTFSGTTPTYDATLEFDLPRFAGMKKDWPNIQFLDMNGRLLPHWLEHDENGIPNGHCYVKVPYIGEQGISIYMEWGEGVKGKHSLKEVFIDADDFNGTELDSTWNIISPTSVVVSNSKAKLEVHSDSGGHYYGIYKTNSLNNAIIKMLAKAESVNVRFQNISAWAENTNDFKAVVGLYDDLTYDPGNWDGVQIRKSDSTILAREVISQPFEPWGLLEVQVNFPYTSAKLSVYSTRQTIAFVETNEKTDVSATYFGASIYRDNITYIDWMVAYPLLNPQPRLLTIYPLLPTTIYTLLSSTEVIKHLLGIDIVTSFADVIDVTANESISDLNATNNLTSTTVVNLFSELLNSIHDVSKVSSSSGTSFVRVSLRTWNDYITHDPVTWAVKQLNNTAEVIAKDGSILEILNNTTAYSSALSTSGYIIISFEDTIRIFENITNALEYAILHPELVINSQQVKSKLVAVEAIAIFTERISYFIKEATAKLLEKYKSSELITTASTEKEQLVENIATAYVKAFELISSLLNAFPHVSKLSTNELLAELERVSNDLQEVIANLATLKESEKIQSALAQESKKFQSEIQSVLEATEDLMALVVTLQKTYNEFAETAKVSESTTDEVISTNKIGENIQSALLSILEQIRKLNLKMLRTLVRKV